jgi:hypothetical protein
VRAHKTPIISIGVQYSTGYIFSCAKEKVLVISEMNYQSVMKGKFSLIFQCLKYQIKRYHVCTMTMILKESMLQILQDLYGLFQLKQYPVS